MGTGQPRFLQPPFAFILQHLSIFPSSHLLFYRGPSLRFFYFVLGSILHTLQKRETTGILPQFFRPPFRDRSREKQASDLRRSPERKIRVKMT